MGSDTAATPRYERTEAEQRHADATNARQVVTRLLGWPMGATARAALRDALDVIDGVDREAIRQMRADAEAKGAGLRVEFRGAAS